ncbi:MAG: hypothetical protein Fur0023_02220 [Bacteroidia bacterium]
MKSHTQIEIDLTNALNKFGKVEIEPTITFDFGNRKYRPDIIFENLETNKKLIIEIKSNQMGFTLNSASYVVDLKNYLDSNSDYKFVLILLSELTPNLSKYIKGRINYYSLKENNLDEIAMKLKKLTE